LRISWNEGRKKKKGEKKVALVSDISSKAFTCPQKKEKKKGKGGPEVLWGTKKIKRGGKRGGPRFSGNDRTFFCKKISTYEQRIKQWRGGKRDEETELLAELDELFVGKIVLQL